MDMSFDGNIYGYEEKTVGTVSATLTAGSIFPTGGIPASGAVFTVETADIRWRCDGGTPGTASPFGHLMGTADSVVITGANSLQNFRAIANGTVDATLIISYFR